MPENVLTIDVGSGTQDILLYEMGKNIENCSKFVVPSRTQIVAAQIVKATEQRQDVFLHGQLMGGGACGVALKKHIAAGKKAYATPQAALTFNDRLANVEKMGVILTEKAPGDAQPIWLGDIDPTSFHQALHAFGKELPAKFAIAVQDHGFSENESNRTLRFRLWRDFILHGGELQKLIFTQEIPEVYTRMRSVREIVPNSIITDTGTAALLGIMTDETVKPHLEKGILAVNIGNSHTLAAAIRGQRVFGIFEQHTGVLNINSLQGLVKRFQKVELTNEEVFEQGGHGVALHPDMRPGWNFVAVTGPRRAMVKPLGWYEAAPYGDMMLTGCFGLLAGMGIL